MNNSAVAQMLLVLTDVVWGPHFVIRFCLLWLSPTVIRSVFVYILIWWITWKLHRLHSFQCSVKQHLQAVLSSRFSMLESIPPPFFKACTWWLCETKTYLLLVNSWNKAWKANKNGHILKLEFGIGQMVQHWRMLVTLPEDMGSVPGTHT